MGAGVGGVPLLSSSPGCTYLPFRQRSVPVVPDWEGECLCVMGFLGVLLKIENMEKTRTKMRSRRGANAGQLTA